MNKHLVSTLILAIAAASAGLAQAAAPVKTAGGMLANMITLPIPLEFSSSAQYFEEG